MDFDDLFKPAAKKQSANGHATVIHLGQPGVNRRANARLNGITGTLLATPSGRRNNTLNWAAHQLGQLVGGGQLQEADVRHALTQAALAAGLDDLETENTINSGLRAGIAEPRTEPDDDAPLPAFNPDTIAGDFWTRRTILTHIRRFAHARRASPWAVLGCTLARVIVATPEWVVLPPLVGGEASLNIFVALVGPSGAGKGAAESAGNDAIWYGTTPETMSVGSGEGLAHCYMHRVKGNIDQHTTAVLASVAEIDTLTALAGRQGATLLPELRKAWVGERLGFAYADPAKRLPVPPHKYRLGLIAGVQPGRAAALLDDVDGGTPQRFIWLPATDPDAPTEAPQETPRWTWEPPQWNRVYADTFTSHVRMDVPEKARLELDQSRLDRLRGHGTNAALDGHLGLARLKVAAALALLDSRTDIQDDDWDLAGVIIDVSNGVRASVQADLDRIAASKNEGRAEAEAGRAVRVAERLEEAVTARVGRVIMRKIKAAGNDGLGAAEVRKSAASRDRIHVETALDALVLSGAVVRTETDHGTRFTTTEGP